MDEKELDIELGENEQAKSTKAQKKEDERIVRLALKYSEAWQAKNGDAIARAKIEKKETIIGDHWPEKEKSERELKGLPCLTLNHAIVHRDGVAGEILQNMPRGKFRGFDNGADPKMAEIGTSILRRIEENSNVQDIHAEVVKQSLISGYPSWIYVYHDYPTPTSWRQEIFFRFLPSQYSVMLDPNATALDRPDRGGPKWGMLIEDMPKAQYEREFPDSAIIDAGKLAPEETDWKTEENIRVASFFLAEPRKIKVLLLQGAQDGVEEGGDNHAMMLAMALQQAGIAMPAKKQDAKSPKDYYAELKEISEANNIAPKVSKQRTATVYDIKHYKINCREVLEGPKDISGEYIPLVPFEGKYDYLDDGTKYYRGVFSNAIDANKMLDFWASKAAENAAIGRQFKATKKQIGPYEDLWNNEKTSKVLYYDIDERLPQGSSPQEVNTVSEVANDVRMMEYAGQNIKDLVNRHNASLGSQGNETSRVAIQARQQQSNNSNYEFVLNYARAIRYYTRVVESMIPTVYDYETLVRIIGEDGREKGQEIINQPMNPGALDFTGDPIQTYMNDVTKARFNTVVDIGPSFSTQRQEAAEMIKTFSQGNPMVAEMLSDLVFKWQDWPGADEAAKRFRFMLEQKYPGMISAGSEGNNKYAEIENRIKQAVSQVEQQAQQAFAAAEQKIAMSEQEKAALAQALQVEQQKTAAATQAMKDKAKDYDIKEREMQIKERDMALKEDEARAKLLQESRQFEVESKNQTLNVVVDMLKSLDNAVEMMIKNSGTDKGVESIAQTVQDEIKIGLAAVKKELEATMEKRPIESEKNFTVMIDNSGKVTRKFGTIKEKTNGEYSFEVKEVPADETTKSEEKEAGE